MKSSPHCALSTKKSYPPLLLVGFSLTLSKCVCDEHWSDLVLFSRCMSLSMTAQSDGQREKQKGKFDFRRPNVASREPIAKLGHWSQSIHFGLISGYF